MDRDLDALCHELIADFLERRGYHDTLKAFNNESSATTPHFTQRPLEELVLDYSNQRVKEATRPANVEKDHPKLTKSAKEKFPTQVTKCWNDVHQGPILCVRYHTLKKTFFDTSLEDYKEIDITCVVSASADKTITYTPYILEDKTPTPEVIVPTASPCLSISFSSSPSHTERIYYCCMDGTINQYCTSTSSLVWSTKDHTKYAVRILVSPSETWLASGGYDGRLCLYRNEGTLDDTKWKLAVQLELGKRVEALLFLPGEQKLAYTLRDDNHLNYLILPTTSTTTDATKEKHVLTVDDVNIEKWNLNANGDDWVSFSILSICIHPNGTHLSLQTDTSLSRIILLPTTSPTPNLFRTLYTTAIQSEYSNPRHAWISHSHVAVSSDDGFIRILDIEGNLKARIAAHGAATVKDEPGESEKVRARREKDAGSSVIRDLCALPDGGIASVGFDKTIQISVVE